VRAGWRDNVPKEPLASYDTREGFEQHVAWEAKLHESRLSMVIWPVDTGRARLRPDRMADLRRGILACRHPMRVNQNGQLLLGPTLMEFGTEAETALPAAHGGQ
jgi:hypothetical protein